MINFPKIFNKNDESDSSKIILPLLPLRDIIVFPYMVAPLFIGREKSVNALINAMNKDNKVFMAAQLKPNLENPREKDMCNIGTIGNVLQLLRLPDGTVKSLVEGRTRARVKRFISEENFFKVELEPIADIEINDVSILAIHKAIIDNVNEYLKLNKSIPRDFASSISGISNPSQLGDTVAAHFGFKILDKQKILETISLKSRLTLILELVKAEIEIFKVDQKIKGQVKEQIDKTQKNYYLNEQIRAIKKEMGVDEPNIDELADLEKKIKCKKLPKEAATKVRQEFKKLKLMTPMSSEAAVVRNYIDWIISLPWFEKKHLKHNIVEAEKILNDDHYGLEKPKERILEYLAVQSLVKKIKGPILCLVGPPGVGKTSLAKSVSSATGRGFIRLSLGGVRDEAEIRGHRRTYVGALPGKIIQSLKKVGVVNPVFCLDEIDKMSMDFRGDPSSALLEVLDPEQNYSFNDHYLDLDYDLSNILFITTANTLHDIPLPLQDRMEVIQISGYTEYEKYNIANQFLVPKQIKANGLTDENIQFSKDAIFAVINEYTKEAGVRNLEREIASICRKVAREILKTQDTNKNEPIQVNAEAIRKYLGPPKYTHHQTDEKDQIGIVTGLAWTQFGGELLCVETLIMHGRGELKITGKLGDVMKESAHAAFSYVRSRSDLFNIDKNFYKKFDIHVHVPEGAIPKDGPSAGITMCTSILSAITNMPVDKNIAMTGEITLRGRILPIGGLKEKILAAHRGGIKKVIVPKENEKDLSDIPQDISKEIEIILVEHMDEVLAQAIIGLEEKTLIKTNIPPQIFNPQIEHPHVQVIH
ncbi:MAG: endopeptidase La [Desulfobacterales bacterium]|nr:endopeptidase La [Desulfobacterales bacterium]